MFVAVELSCDVSSVLKKVVHRQPDVGNDLAQQRRRNVPPLVEWHSGDAPICMAELLVRTALANLDEPQHLEGSHDLSGLQTGVLPMASRA